jgi:hypothetical protein
VGIPDWTLQITSTFELRRTLPNDEQLPKIKSPGSEPGDRTLAGATPVAGIPTPSAARDRIGFFNTRHC